MLVYVHSSLPHSVLKNYTSTYPNTSSSTFALHIYHNNRSINVCFVYLQPNNNDENSPVFSTLNSICNNPPDTPLLLIGDFNAHHPHISMTESSTNRNGI